ncbi:hypothetical protein GCM10010269_71490 [Streptomyces humidus]|uniref:Uncharacterized protein n=1 Tax=Streptomyces humidus TaxID=52259 RepID=A0A918L9I3_9ACTN|nr:hypothetical protein GCM10010269_71490 [Streptomyces humidus]
MPSHLPFYTADPIRTISDTPPGCPRDGPDEGAAQYRPTCRVSGPVQLTLYNAPGIAGVSRASQQHTDWRQDSCAGPELTLPLQTRRPARQFRRSLAETPCPAVDFSYASGIPCGRAVRARPAPPTQPEAAAGDGPSAGLDRLVPAGPQARIAPAPP